MRPREDEGVIDQELKVHGTTNLRVVDASIFPLMLIPHARCGGGASRGYYSQCLMPSR